MYDIPSEFIQIGFSIQRSTERKFLKEAKIMAQYRTKLSEQQANYKSKEDVLRTNFEQVSPMDFYREIFPEGFLQAEGVESDGRGCGIFRFKPDKSTLEQMKDRLKRGRNAVLAMENPALTDIIHTFGLQLEKDDSLDAQLDELDRKFQAGKYRKPFQPIEMSVMYDQRVHDNLLELGEAIGKRVAYMAPISYYGKKANAKNARYLHALVIDLDGVGMEQFNRVLVGLLKGQHYMCKPTYAVNSGHGLHLYYVLKEPIPCYHYLRDPLTRLKNSMAFFIWNRETSIFRNHRDDQPWCQLYRVVGSQTKLGAKYSTTAYRVGEKVTLEDINQHLPPDMRINLPLDTYKPKGKSGKSLEYWKNEAPEWYAKHIEGKQNTKEVTQAKFPWLYESFLEKMRDNAKVGTRYHCASVLFADASLCGIPYQKVYDTLVADLDLLNDDAPDDKLFTIEDINCAARFYNKQFGNWLTLDRIEAMTEIKFERNKRNGRSQADHLKIARFTRDEVYGKKDTWREGNGRPKGSKNKPKTTPARCETIVRNYLQEHPDAKKVEVIRETGLSKPTVYKWYDLIMAEKN